MRLHQPICPECGEPANGTVERLSGRADLSPPQADGTTEYTGWTDIWWDEQRTAHQKDRAPEGPSNLPLVCCPNGHEWATPIEW